MPVYGLMGTYQWGPKGEPMASMGAPCTPWVVVGLGLNILHALYHGPTGSGDMVDMVSMAKWWRFHEGDMVMEPQGLLGPMASTGHRGGQGPRGPEGPTSFL